MAGFYATRIVLAENADQAADIAKRRLLNDLPKELPGSPEPDVRIDSIYEADAEELLEETSGFSFYAEPD